MALGVRPNKLPIRLIISYALDWLVIIGLAAAAGGVNWVEPYKRPFSLLDLSISYPRVDQELISTGLLVALSLPVPAAIIFVVVAIFVPGRRVYRISTRKQYLLLKLWELEKGLAGLCLSCAVAFFITQCAKNLFGKPRPSMLARCQPDLTNVAKYVVGGYGEDISERWTLVSADICTQTDTHLLNDAFRSFPSGHSSFSWSGLLYLTLFLCSKFQITVPHLPLQTNSAETAPPPTRERELLPLHNRASTEDDTKPFNPNESPADRTLPQPRLVRSAGASPPLYLLVLALIPVAIAVYICSTRFVQFYHFGFDIISGSLIGILTSWFSFRWYHMPVSRGQGWAWGPRSRTRAFLIGVGNGTWVDNENGEERRQVGRSTDRSSHEV